MLIRKKPKNGFFLHWYRQIVYAWQNVYSDICCYKLTAILTIFVISVTTTLPVISYLLWKNANTAATLWSPKPYLTVYLDNTLSEHQIKQLDTQIANFPTVETVEFHSKKQNMEEFTNWSGFGESLALLDHNPLPDLFIVVPTRDSIAKEDATLNWLRKKISLLKGVDDVRFDDSWFDHITALTRLIAAVVWGLSFLMIIAAFLVIGNSIRTIIFFKSQAIMVMQLVGATDGFILRPFLYSGLFYGFFSAVVALILTELFIFRIDFIILDISSVFGIEFRLSRLSWDESLFVLMLSALVGWLSAWLATKKYLQILQNKP